MHVSSRRPSSPPPCARSGLPPPLPPNFAASCFSSAPASTVDVRSARNHDLRGRCRREQRDDRIRIRPPSLPPRSPFRPCASQPSSASTTSRRCLAREQRLRFMSGELLLEAADVPLNRFRVLLHLLDRCGHVDRRDGQVLLHRRQRAAPHPEALQRAAAAQELDARSALELLPRRRSRSRRSRRSARRACRRRPTGRSPCTSISRSGPVRAGFLAQRHRRRFLGGREPDRDRPILPDDRDSHRLRPLRFPRRIPRAPGRSSTTSCPMWKLSVRTPNRRSNAADSTCWPVCCCM